MNSNDIQRFDSVLSMTNDITGGKEITKEVKKVWWKILSKYSIDQVARAFDSHIRSSKFTPKPADIIEIINDSDGRPTADQAWAIAIKSIDESETVAWTNEAANAFLSSAKNIVDSGDKIGARIAFKDSYNKLVQESRSNGDPVKWSLSLGHDKQKRHSAAIAAIENGTVKKIIAEKYLIHEESNSDIKNILGFDGESQNNENKKNKENIKKLKNDLKNSAMIAKKYREQMLERDKQIIIERKRIVKNG